MNLSVFNSPYDPKNTEKRIYRIWEESGFFNPDNLPGDRPKNFCIVMPPPNANGHLHAGHSLFITLEDIMTRYKRMNGYKTLWVPGADHAGFETQVVYEKKLEKEGRSRFQIPKEDLYQEILNFTLENKKYMEEEVRSLGASCDWSREKFTLDPEIILKTQQTFKKIFDDGLIYRGQRAVNWCVKHQTSLSDLETEQKEKEDFLYYIQYGPIIVATVRPETIFGDTAIAVHPEDERHQKYINQTITLEIPGPVTLNLKVIAEESVEKEFGTGALKITPAHDAHDFEIGQKHNLPVVQVIDERGRLNEKTGKYFGMKIEEARKQIVEDLQQNGLLKKIEPYKHSVPVCYKCGTVIEPRVMDQWFVKMKPLTEIAIKAVEDGRIKFIPDNYRKIFNYWMTNSIDWNISRQIIWGIPIPAKICEKCKYGFPDLENSASSCPKCQGPIRRETDTFDTWFSSGQWPFLVLGYPDSEDFKKFYPTQVMETGYDLIFKWVPRMVIFGLYITKDVPFETVYLHGLVNDKFGKKMSKSKGNVINPVELTEKYGTDALRFALIMGNTPGTDLALSEEKIKGCKNFANKIWNAGRFVLSAVENFDLKNPSNSEQSKKWLEEFQSTKDDITKDIEEFRIYLAAEKIYHYFWHEFADKIIETAKPILKSNSQEKPAIQSAIYEIFKSCLKILHPFMPFITEEIWQYLPEKETKLLIVADWPNKK